MILCPLLIFSRALSACAKHRWHYFSAKDLISAECLRLSGNKEDRYRQISLVGSIVATVFSSSPATVKMWSFIISVATKGI